MLFQKKNSKNKTGTPFVAKFQSELVVATDDIIKNISNKNFQLLDARTPERFYGKGPEPRKGIESGSIPGSINTPFQDLFAATKNNEGTEIFLLKNKDEVIKYFEGKNIIVNEKPKLVTMCGSGVTAAIIVLALHSCGLERVPIYDGSWTQYSQTSHTPKQFYTGKQ